MSKRQPSSRPPAEKPSEEYMRFERFANALFRVDKRDVPKHEPKKRTQRSPEHLDSDQE
jgi:hypothetical protein